MIGGERRWRSSLAAHTATSARRRTNSSTHYVAATHCHLHVHAVLVESLERESYRRIVELLLVGGRRLLLFEHVACLSDLVEDCLSLLASLTN